MPFFDYNFKGTRNEENFNERADLSSHPHDTVIEDFGLISRRGVATPRF